MRMFLSGPITGDEFYREKFALAKEELKEHGYSEVLNPAELCRVLPEGTDYETCMTICEDLLQTATAIVQLPGWQKSLGANRELGYARALDKIVLQLDDLIEGVRRNDEG